MGDSMPQQQNRTRDEIARSHVDQVVESHYEMSKAGKNCDCSIEVIWSGRKVSSLVHYTFVSAASEYCKSNAICKKGKWTVKVDGGYWQDAPANEIMKDALRTCVKFMYIGKVHITDVTAVYITVLSHNLQLKPLEDMGFKKMYVSLTSWQNCFTLLMVARFCERKEYEAEAIGKWVLLNLQEIPELNECSPENLWWSAAHLFQTSPDFRQCKMLDVLKLINIEKSYCDFLLNVVMMNKEVTRDLAAAKYIFKIICQKINQQPLNINCGNYHKIKNLLAIYGRNDTSGLKVRLHMLIINNFDVLSQQVEFLETNQNEVTSIFSSPHLTCTEKIKFDSMVRWVKHKPQRAKTFPGLFTLMKLQNLSEEEVIDVKKNSLVESNASLLSDVFDALANKRKSASLQPRLLQAHPETARLGNAQRPECDNSSNASERSRRTMSSNGISGFSTASLREDQASLVTSSNSGVASDYS